VKRRKLLLSTKNREAWLCFSAKLVIRIIFTPDGSPRPSGTVCLARLNALNRNRRLRRLRYRPT